MDDEDWEDYLEIKRAARIAEERRKVGQFQSTLNKGKGRSIDYMGTPGDVDVKPSLREDSSRPETANAVNNPLSQDAIKEESREEDNESELTDLEDDPTWTNLGNITDRVELRKVTERLADALVQKHKGQVALPTVDSIHPNVNTLRTLAFAYAQSKHFKIHFYIIWDDLHEKTGFALPCTLRQTQRSSSKCCPFTIRGEVRADGTVKVTQVVNQRAGHDGQPAGVAFPSALPNRTVMREDEHEDFSEDDDSEDDDSENDESYSEAADEDHHEEESTAESFGNSSKRRRSLLSSHGIDLRQGSDQKVAVDEGGKSHWDTMKIRVK